MTGQFQKTLAELDEELEGKQRLLLHGPLPHVAGALRVIFSG